MNLSLMSRQVVATGGGAVTLPINWYVGAIYNTNNELL